jgi:hypothetical protein
MDAALNNDNFLCNPRRCGILDRFTLRLTPGLACLVVAMLLAAAVPCTGQGVFVGPDGKSEPKTLRLPYAFYNENFGFAVGYVQGVVGYPQKQSAILGTIMAGTQGSAMGFFFGRDLQIPRTQRLFVDPIVSVGYFEDNRAFVDGNPAFPFERAGSNDSDQDDFVEGDGWDNFFRVTFKYVLPVGQGRDEVISTYVIDRGLAVAGDLGARSWNPLESGKTYLELRPFYRSQDVDGDFFDDKIQTNGLNFSLFWDNRDFFANPSRGFSAQAEVGRDFGWFDSTNEWTNVNGELDFYIPLGASENFRQRVIALAYWTSYSPSWEVQPDGTIADRPPAYAGSTLGGLWRLRGYPSQRFSDKAAVYYAAELRMMPEWNPFDGWPWLQQYVGIQWLQLVPFAEVGRVAPSWKLDELHSDMKWTLGFGIRAWAKGIVARIDTAFSDEDFKIQMMVGQPFQF